MFCDSRLSVRIEPLNNLLCILGVGGNNLLAWLSSLVFFFFLSASKTGLGCWSQVTPYLFVRSLKLISLFGLCCRRQQWHTSLFLWLTAFSFSVGAGDRTRTQGLPHIWQTTIEPHLSLETFELSQVSNPSLELRVFLSFGLGWPAHWASTSTQVAFWQSCGHGRIVGPAPRTLRPGECWGLLTMEWKADSDNLHMLDGALLGKRRQVVPMGSGMTLEPHWLPAQRLTFDLQLFLLLNG